MESNHLSPGNRVRRNTEEHTITECQKYWCVDDEGVEIEYDLLQGIELTETYLRNHTYFLPSDAEMGRYKLGCIFLWYHEGEMLMRIGDTWEVLRYLHELQNVANVFKVELKFK